MPDIYDELLTLLDTHHPEIPAWERIVWMGWMMSHHHYGLHIDDPREVIAADLWQIVHAAQDGDYTRLDDLLNVTIVWWKSRVIAGCLGRMRQDSPSYYVLKGMATHDR